MHSKLGGGEVTELGFPARARERKVEFGVNFTEHGGGGEIELPHIDGEEER